MPIRLFDCKIQSKALRMRIWYDVICESCIEKYEKETIITKLSEHYTGEVCGNCGARSTGSMPQI